MYNVAIGICSGGTVCAETVTSLIGALDTLHDKNVGVMVSMQVGGYKPYNVNKLIASAQEHGATHFMSIDTDMIFPTSGIIRLLDHDKDIVGAAYNARGNPTAGNPMQTVIKMADAKGNPINASADAMPKHLFKCSGLGLGFTLIKMSVFDKLEKPYFRDFESPEGEHHTEDIEFCNKAMKAGFDIWCSPTIKIGHIGTYTY